ncbi:MAG: DoxX-like family protein [Verrucomicrobiota bacterium]|nr:DoxX-like family protein [Verrucomicrobiota bacterium]
MGADDIFRQSNTVQTLTEITIGSVWVFHGLYSKILNGIPRHRLIVGRILGNEFASRATKVIGLLEVLLGLWVFTGWERFGCAVVQTLAIIGMNTLEILLAGDLLISAIGMVLLNLGFLALVWHWAFFGPKS